MKKYLSEGWPYSYSIDDYEIFKPLEEIKEERDADSIISSYIMGHLSRYFDSKGKEIIKEKREAIEKEYKQKIKDLLDTMEHEYLSKAVEGRKRLEALMPIYGKRIIAHMIIHSELSYMDIDKVIECLPSKDILEKDLAQYEILVSYASGYSSRIDYPLSLKLVMDLVEDKSLDEYPEELAYIHQVCTGTGLKMIETKATFTKTEFLESVKSKQKVFKK